LAEVRPEWDALFPDFSDIVSVQTPDGFIESAQKSLATPERIQPRKIHRWYHQRVNDMVRINLTPVNSGQKMWLWVDESFYRRKLRRMVLYTSKGEVFTYPHDQRLAHLIANDSGVFDFYSIHKKRSELGIVDLRAVNLRANYDSAEKEHQQELAANYVRELIGATGKDNGDLTDEQVLDSIMASAIDGRVKDVHGHRMPTDSYRPRLMQVNGKIVHQVFDNESNPAKPISAKSWDVDEPVPYAPRLSTAPVSISMPKDVCRDKLPIDEDVQRLMDANLNPKTTIRPKKTTGSNGIVRSGELERGVPPWAASWAEQSI
jgi:hypothetical protein